MTLMMTSVQVVESSVNVNHNLPTYDVTPGFKPFTVTLTGIALTTPEIIGLSNCKNLTNTPSPPQKNTITNYKMKRETLKNFVRKTGYDCHSFS